ncbi:MAG TPA: IS481 family transposase [Gemmatimonadales bacterium]
MAQLLHGSATTTARLRTLFQTSAEPATVLARRYGVNPKTVRKWRRRDSVDDWPMGPRQPRSAVLSELEETAVVAFRVQTRLPLDDVFVALRSSIPALTRSTLHRCLQRQGVSRLPHTPKQRRGQFRAYEIGYFHIDIAELRTAREKAYLFLAVDRTSKLAFARIYRRATSMVAAAFLKVLAKGVPYRIHTVLTDNGIQFSAAGQRRTYPRAHPFARMCRLLRIEHRLTKPYHPWTNGQAERMVRTLKEATVRAFHYDSLHALRAHVADYLAAYNFAKHLKALRWRTPYEALEALWSSRPELFRRSPDHLTLGPNT